MRTHYIYSIIFLFSISTINAQAPGGVLTNNTLWLKADAGTSSTTDGAAVNAWNNQTGTGGNATTTSNTGTGWTAAAVAAPLYQSGSNSVGINFNPSLNFNGNKWLDGNGNFSTANTFVVSKFLSTPSSVGPTIIGFDRSTGTGGLVESSFYSFNNTYGYQAGAANGNFVEADIAYTLWSIPTVFEGRHVSNASMISTVNAGGTSTYVQLGATRPNPYTGKFRLGNSSDNMAAIESGVIGEVISYNTNLSATDRLKVQSYLALKYGISLGTTAAAVNYTASDATVLWTGNATYQNNIAGIARDDASALSQKQSKSVNMGLQVVMGNGNTIATSNALNTNTFSADKSALIWGDNAGAVAAWTTSGAPSARQIVARTWKVQETGTVGSVKVQIADNGGTNGLPSETNTVYLLVDADGNFSAGAGEVAMTLNGTNWEVDVDLTNGQFFTFATQVPPAPGGVTGSAIWLKANAGVTTGTTLTWADQSGNNRNGVQSTATNQPTLNSNLINFNPALVLDGTNDYLNLQNLTGLPTGAAQVEGFTVARNLNTGGGWNHVIAYGGTAGNSFFTLGKQTGTANAVTGFNGSDAISSALEYTGGAPVLSNGKYTGTQGVISTFGRQRGTVNFTGAKAITNGKIGVDPTTALTTCWNGNIAEAILFSGNLNTTQVSQINTYLAIKYGITLDQTTAQNYLASDGSTIFWNGTTNSTHKTNIASIARDDASALSQKQSKSVNSGLQVIVGNGNTIATDNASNTSTFSADKSALVWGDDAASVAAWTTSGAPSARQIVARTWKVQETGTVGSVKVQIADNGGANGLPSETNTVYLLVDADGNFSAGAGEVAMTLNGTNWEVDVDLTNGQFFTFATQVPPAPGGVSSNNVLWLRPDAGTLNGGSAATNGQTVTTWQDQTPNANHFTTATTEGVITGAPTWISNSMNFNPGLGFNGTQGLHRTSNLYTNNSNFEIINVHTNSGAGGIVFGNNSGDNQNPIFARYGYAQFINASSTIIDIANGGSNSPRVYHLSRTNTSGSNHSITNYFNGKSVGTGTSTANFTANNSKTTIGYRSYSNDGGRQPSLDPIHEVIVYNANITATQRQQINSYLAIKYGFSLDQTVATNYLNSSGTAIWDASANAAYTNNIAGIARDDASALSQKQSKSVNTGLQVVMGNGNTIATTNALNTNTFSADNSALVWGDDAASVAAWTTTGAPPSRQIVARKWKTQETGTVGYVKVQVPDNGGTNGLPAETNTIYLLVDADGNFASGATEVAMTLNGTNWEAPVDFTNGQFFTFATQESSPVALNLTMVGDKTTVTSGQNITYTLTLTNTGTNTATNVQVKDKIPAGVNFVSATPSAGTYNPATGIWHIPSAAPGARTLTIVVTAQ